MSTIGGNLGSAANPSVGGGYIFTSGSLQGNTVLAQDAQLELDAAIVSLSAFGVGTTVTSGDLDAFQTFNGGFISPGTYTVPAALVNLAGALVLDGGGNHSALALLKASLLGQGELAGRTVKSSPRQARSRYWDSDSRQLDLFAVAAARSTA